MTDRTRILQSKRARQGTNDDEASGSNPRPGRRQDRNPNDIPINYQPRCSREMLERKRIIGHRTLDFGVLDTLGLSNDVDELLTPDWQKFFHINTRIFRDLVIEFFSTYRVNLDLCSTRGTAMTFSLGGRPHTLSFAEFGIAMGLYDETEVRSRAFTNGLIGWPVDMSPAKFWRDFQIGTDEYHSNIKQTSMDDPAQRIVLRAVAESINNRTNCPNNATGEDLFYLYCMLAKEPCNLAICLARYLYEKGHGRSKGAIGGGSFVCRLALGLGVVTREFLAGEGAIDRVYRLDADALRSMGIIERYGPPRLISRYRDDTESEDEGNEGEASDEDEDDEEAPTQHTVVHPDGLDPFSFQGLAHQLGLIQETQNRQENSFHSFQDSWGSFQDRYAGDHQMIQSQFDRVQYTQDRFQPYMETWAREEASRYNLPPLPPSNLPEIFIPPHRQGGFYYPPPQQQQQHAQGFDSMFEQAPLFGTYHSAGGGEPSIFGQPDDMDE